MRNDRNNGPRHGEGVSRKVNQERNNSTMLSSRLITIEELKISKKRFDRIVMPGDTDMEIDCTGVILDKVFAYSKDGQTRYSRRLGFILKDGREFQLPFGADVIPEMIERMSKGETYFKLHRNGSGYDSRYILVDE
jgi:hypothetical protein